MWGELFDCARQRGKSSFNNITADWSWLECRHSKGRRHLLDIVWVCTWLLGLEFNYLSIFISISKRPLEGSNCTNACILSGNFDIQHVFYFIASYDLCSPENIYPETIWRSPSKRPGSSMTIVLVAQNGVVRTRSTMRFTYVFFLICKYYILWRKMKSCVICNQTLVLTRVWSYLDWLPKEERWTRYYNFQTLVMASPFH